jgi:hypothetical protein
MRVVFRRVHGRVVPIRSEKKDLRVNKSLLAASAAVNVASGIVAGLTTFRGGFKTALFGNAASSVADVAATSLNVAAHQGRGRRKERLVSFAKKEAGLQALGYGAMAATIALDPVSRTNAIKWGAGALKFARRVILRR